MRGWELGKEQRSGETDGGSLGLLEAVDGGLPVTQARHPGWSPCPSQEPALAACSSIPHLLPCYSPGAYTMGLRDSSTGFWKFLGSSLPSWVGCMRDATLSLGLLLDTRTFCLEAAEFYCVCSFLKKKKTKPFGPLSSLKANML